MNKVGLTLVTITICLSLALPFAGCKDSSERIDTEESQILYYEGFTIQDYYFGSLGPADRQGAPAYRR